VKKDDSPASEILIQLLRQVPVIQNVRLREVGANLPGLGDFLIDMNVAGRRHAIACEVKESGQPRHVRQALLRIKAYFKLVGGTTPVIIAPYLSAESQTLCREQNVGYMDLEGNIRLAFEGVFIERLVSAKPAPARRELKSLFRPKSARVLKVMLQEPVRTWRVTELAEAADVSLGHVSNVRVGLLDREWAEVSDGGLYLSQPDKLLDAWRDVYEPPAGPRLLFYTSLHSGAFENAARKALSLSKGHASFASLSAAHWIAPYARTSINYFHADKDGLAVIRNQLKLTTVEHGENVVVLMPKDEGILLDTIEPAPGAICTSPVQTYLDLNLAGERGREAADHLRTEKLTWWT